MTAPDAASPRTRRSREVGVIGALALLIVGMIAVRAVGTVPPQNFPAALVPAVEQVAQSTLMGQDVTVRDNTGGVNFNGRTYLLTFSAALPSTADLRKVAWNTADRVIRLPDLQPDGVQAVTVSEDSPEPTCAGEPDGPKSCSFEADATLVSGDTIKLEVTVSRTSGDDPVYETLNVILTSPPPEPTSATG